jgi:hypothetical protein
MFLLLFLVSLVINEAFVAWLSMKPLFSYITALDADCVKKAVNRIKQVESLIYCAYLQCSGSGPEPL